MAASVGALVLFAAPASACQFAEVKAAIDTVLDKDAALGKEFRRQFADGLDSIFILEQMVSAEMRTRIDVCRFHVAEYLAKRGFPPAH